MVAEFKERVRAKVRRQEKIDRVKDRNFRREKLPEKYIAKILYKWNNEKFEVEYLILKESDIRNLLNGLGFFHFSSLLCYM